MTANANHTIFHTLARAFKPRQHITVSDWSDLHVVLSSKGSSEAGQFRTSRNELFAAQFSAETIEHLLTGLEKHFKKLAIESHE